MKSFVLGILWIVFDLASTVWLPWWNEEFHPNPELEDEYIYEFGNDEHDFEDEENFYEWPTVRSLYTETGIEKLTQFCEAAHREAGRGNVTVNAITLVPRTLSFQNPFYESRPVDVLTYGVEGEADLNNTYWDMVVGTQGYMAEGLRPNCVCYLILLSSLRMEFSLYEHVCDINIPGITDVKAKRKKLSTLASFEGETKKSSKSKSTKKTTKKSTTKGTSKKSTKKTTKKSTKENTKKSPQEVSQISTKKTNKKSTAESSKGSNKKTKKKTSYGTWS